MQNSARNRNPLALATRQPRPTLADLGVVAIREPHNKVVRIRSFCCLDHTQWISTWLGIGDVLINAPREQIRLLENNPELTSQVVELDLPHINAIHQNAALIRIVETRNQVDDRGLASSRMANETNHLTRLDIEAEVVQDTPRLVIPKADLLKGDRTRDMRHRLRIHHIRHIGFRVHNLKHTLGTRKSPRQPVRNTRHPLQWAIKLPKIEEEEVERTKGHRALDNLTTTHVPDDKDARHHQKREDWEERCPPVFEIKVDTEEVCRTQEEAVILTVFRCKCLDHTRTCDG